MIKSLIFLIGISSVFSLTCTNEFTSAYNSIIPDSELTTQVCHTCPAHCLDCSNKNICTECDSGYFKQKDKDSNVECVSNLVMNNGCLLWDLEKCQECEETYWLNKTSCVKKKDNFIEMCQTWSSATIESQEKCIEAKSGYGLISQGTEFTKCVDNCEECSETKCAQCALNYRLSDDQLTCIENQGICLTWKQTTTEECNSCPVGYQINQNLCYHSLCECESGKGPLFPDCSIDCPTNCTTCSEATRCTGCISGHYLDTGSCQKQCKENCEVCTSGDNCQKCKKNYYASGDNCESCSDNCEECENNSKCNQCDKTTMLTTNDDCKSPLIQNCQKSEDGTTCFSCHEGFYINNNVCQSCSIDNCAQCSDATTCTQCNFGYILYNDGVNKPSCITCTDHSKYEGICGQQKWMKFPWKCSDLESHCTESEVTVLIGVNEQFCNQCESGYRVKDKKCVKCLIDGCINCNSDENDCDICNIGFFKDSSQEQTKCGACIANCNQCDNSTICLDCAYGYAYNSELTVCEKCSKNTAKCEKCWKLDECLECNTGYYLKDNSCLKCSENCTNCYDSTNCLKCSEFYYFAADFQCRSCISNCQVCENNITCKQCGDNFVLSSDMKECMNKDACKAENVNCKVCNTSDTNKCMECNDEYYYETTICKNCLSNCLNCENSKTCKLCKSGYDLNSDKTECNKVSVEEIACIALIEGCVKCDLVYTQRCSYCQQGSVPNQEGKCECGQGFQLIEGECLEQVKTNIDFEDIEAAEISDLLTYIDQSTTGEDKGNNTEKMLKQLKSKLTKIDSTSGSQAASLLIQLSQTTTTENGQSYYKEILKNLCSEEGLDDNVYYSAITAADQFYLIINGTSRQTIYDYGFTNCVKNYLKKASPGNISVIKLKNSELQVKEIVISSGGNSDQELKFSDTSVVASIDLKTYLQTKSEDKKYYMIAQAINHDGNPFKFRQKNSVMYESKLMSVTIMSKESQTDTNTPSLINIELGKNNFNITFDFEGTKCGHYDEEKLEWMFDGNATGQTCQFNHTTHFVIYQEKTEEASYADLMKVLGIFWILIFVLF